MIRDLDSSLRPAAGSTLDNRLLREMAPQQFGMFVLGTLSTVALLLTLLGTYVIPRRWR